MDPYLYCLLLLKKRFKSRYELDQSMKRRSVEEVDRQQVLEELEAQGFVDDLRFARAWLHDRDLFAPRGKLLLRQELLKKGIEKDIIQTVLTERADNAESEEEDQVDEVTLGKQLVRGKERYYSNLTPEVRMRRVMGLLQRRGFSYDVIRRILDT